MALVVGQQFGDYEILGELGRGGMGAVYRARQLSLQRIVALKILPPHVAGDAGLAARFQTEAIAAASLNHANIVQVFATGEHNGIRFIAMEFVEGETIGQRLKRCGRLPITESLDIAYHVATALDYAWQSAQLIHRDVKPDNVFLAANGTVKLGDFGLAKSLREGASSVTMTGHVMGSPHFISPEQAHGERDIDFRADIYSLGCALHYLMTGRMVFEGPDFVSIILKHVNDEPAPLQAYLPDCPPTIAALLARMLEKARDRRPQSYAELIGQILLARDEAERWEASGERRSGSPTTQLTQRRPQLVYVIAALAPVLVAAWFVYSKLSTGSPTPHTNIVTLADPSDRRDFIASVERMTPFERIEAVMAKLREVNPAFTGKEKFTVEDGAITELSFPAAGVKNLWPITALRHVRVLRCTGDAKHRAELADLSALAELSELEEVDCSWTSVANLKPLAALPLKLLRCAGTRIDDLSALKGAEITELDVSDTRVHDLAPLGGKQLVELRCANTRVTDLSPLRNAPLKILWCDPRVLHPDLVKSWKEMDEINGVSATEVGKKLRGGKATKS